MSTNLVDNISSNVLNNINVLEQNIDLLKKQMIIDNFNSIKNAHQVLLHIDGYKKKLSKIINQLEAIYELKNYELQNKLQEKMHDIVLVDKELGFNVFDKRIEQNNTNINKKNKEQQSEIDDRK